MCGRTDRGVAGGGGAGAVAADGRARRMAKLTFINKEDFLSSSVKVN
jgi:hypothetical protein